MVGDVMSDGGLAFTAVDRIAVTVGPGSFTGLRVGLAFAKGLALALAKPCVGVGTLEALAASAGDGRVAVAIDAGRGNIYLQLFEAGRALTAPDILAVGTAAARSAEVFGDRPFRLSGPGANLLAETWPGVEQVQQAFPTPEAVLALGTGAALIPARPLYLRPADAKPKVRVEPAWS